ncbi:MAG: ABC transporter substrate-binding protein [Acidimicrobiales bacterium]
MKTLRSSHIKAAIVLLAAVSVGAAACGSGPASNNTTSTSASLSGGGSSTTTTSPPATINLQTAPPGEGLPKAAESSMLHGQLPSAIKKKDSLTYAMDATYAPDEFLAPNGKTIIGMDADFALALSQVLGIKANLVAATFDTIIPGLQSGKYDIGNSSFTDTKAREKQVNFVDYFSAGEAFYEPANSTHAFNGLASLCGHTVSVESGTTEQADALSQAKKCHVTVLAFPDQNAANVAVTSGRAQLGFADSQVSAYIVRESKGQFKLTGSAFATAPYGIAVPKGPLDMVVLGAMHELVSDGLYKKIIDKWGLQPGAIPLSEIKINGAAS